MAVTAISRPVEDFIIQINGEYNICFDEIDAPRDVVAGQVSQASDSVFGIFAKPAKAGERVRIMVRGNPSTINSAALTADGAMPSFALKEAGLILV